MSFEERSQIRVPEDRGALPINAAGYIGSIDTPYNLRPADLPYYWDSNVYFIQAHPDGPIKIGIAGDPYLRLQKMQVNSPMPLILKAFCEGTVSLER